MILEVIFASIAIISATAMIVTSCSSSNTASNSALQKFHKSLHLIKVWLLRSWCIIKTKHLQDKGTLKTFILINVIYDFKDSITVSDIKISKSIPNLALGTLNIKYTVSNTYVSGILQENSIK